MTDPLSQRAAAPTRTWVIGAGGLLGSALAAAERRAGSLWAAPSAVPWSSGEAGDVLAYHARAFAEEARDGAWRIAWCAGAGVTTSAGEALDREVSLHAEFLSALSASGLDPARGALFQASSAGGVYAGSVGAPFDEFTPPAPISPYGEVRLRMEQQFRTWVSESGTRGLIGRIANLYGPGQNLTKSQGLVSHIVKSVVTRQPLSVFVPLDTLRDYLTADDCAAMITTAFDVMAARTAPGETTVKVLASGRATTVGGLIAETRRVLKRRPTVVFASSPGAKFQTHDLRLRSTVWPDVDRAATTTLPAGISEIVRVTLEANRELGSRR